MIPLVTAPNLGSGLKASWGASVASAINQLANGLETRAKPLENQRNRRGGSASVPAMFEPKFSDDGTLTSVGSGFIPFGRSFYWKKSPSLNSSSKSGLAVLRIKHPTESSQLSCEVVVMSYTKNNSDGYLTTSGYDTSDIPLYFFANGEITMDCRYLLSLSVREIG